MAESKMKPGSGCEVDVDIVARKKATVISGMECDRWKSSIAAQISVLKLYTALPLAVDATRAKAWHVLFSAFHLTLTLNRTHGTADLFFPSPLTTQFAISH
jgi:hypothetical protein